MLNIDLTFFFVLISGNVVHLYFTRGLSECDTLCNDSKMVPADFGHFNVKKTPFLLYVPR